jgi:cell division protein FtsW
MARKLRFDRLLFVVAVLLVCASVVMVFSASAVLAKVKFQHEYLFLLKQATWAGLGFLMLAIVMRIDYRSYRQPFVIWTLLGVVTAALVAVLFGPEINGTKRWFAVAGVGIQPSELAKLAAILFTAALLERRMERVNDLNYSLRPVALMVACLAGLIVVEDLGTALILVATVVAMVFAAGLSYRYLLTIAGCAVPVVAAVVWLEPYRLQRILTYLDPSRDPQGAGFHVNQSLIAVGTGGVFGRGLWGSQQKLFYLPEPHTDFIYAVISEELGLIGAVAVAICFAVIAWRGVVIAQQAPDRFGAFLALGLTTMIVLQALVNISVVLALLPAKGLPLPFVSAGGSSLLINLLAMGVLLNVSQHTTART